MTWSGALGVVFLSSVVLACSRPKEVTPEIPPPSVLTIKAERSIPPALVRRGAAMAAARFRLAFNMPGAIETLRCRVGDHVTKGQLVATLRAAEARARLRSAQAQESKARRDLDLAERLSHEGALGTNAPKEARDQLDFAAAQVAIAAEMEGFSRLHSPVTGTVSQRLAEPGEMVGAGMPVLVVEEIGRLVVRVGVTEFDLPRLSLGAPVLLRAETGTLDIEGTVSSISPAPDQTDGLYAVEISPSPKAPHLFASGALVTVRFRNMEHEQSVRVPLDALVDRRGHQGVFLIDHSTNPPRSIFRALTVSRVEGDTAWVKEGLAGDEELIAEGAYFLEEGSPVRVLSSGVSPHG